MLGWLSLYFTGVLTILIEPTNGCSISLTIPLAKTCLWLRVPWISLTAEYGKPEPSKISNHSCVVFVMVIPSIKLSSTRRWATRCVLIANLGSVFHSGRPKPSQMSPYSLSFPPPNKTSPSLVLYDRYGTIEAII